MDANNRFALPRSQIYSGLVIRSYCNDIATLYFCKVIARSKTLQTSLNKGDKLNPFYRTADYLTQELSIEAARKWIDSLAVLLSKG